MAELQGLQLKRDEFAARNTEILAVVVDPVERNAEVARDVGIEYRILADPDLRVIDAYDLRHPGGADGKDIARPATFLLDEQGIVRWRSLTENYRMRPRPEEILAQIRD